MTQTPHEIEAQTTFPSRIPIVAIVGRPNAGKSTLFNRLLRQRKAVVDNKPGVTRDRNFAQAVWQGLPMLLIDTGGLEFQDTDSLNSRVQDQTRLAISEADVIIFLFDGREGLNPADAEAVDLLRRTDKPTFFAVNKIDGDKQEAAAAEFFALGLDPLYTISAAHGPASPTCWRRSPIRGGDLNTRCNPRSAIRLPPPSGGNPQSTVLPYTSP